LRRHHIGDNDDQYTLSEPLDRGRGSYQGESARVFLASIPERGQAAFKVLRSRHLGNTDYAGFFGEEAMILDILQDLRAITPLLECGYVQPEHAIDDDTRTIAGGVVEVADSPERFASEAAQKSNEGWLPYLALARRKPARSLLYTMEESVRFQRLLPMWEVLDIADQVTALLEEAHARGIAYSDWKPAHFFWDHGTLHVVDWNSSQRLQGRKAAIAADVRLAAAILLYPLATGRPIKDETFQLSPLQVPLSAHAELNSMDRDRLGEVLAQLVEDAASGEIRSASSMRQRLRSCHDEWGNPDGVDGIDLARSQIEEAIIELRKAQEGIERALDHVHGAQLLARDSEASVFQREQERLARQIASLRWPSS
jgi:hypothetical protein